jgi:hypothetical protein
MLPKFTIIESRGRFFVETDWSTDGSIAGTRSILMVDTNGRLVISCAGWAKREKAEQAIERCRMRLQ